MEEVRNVIDFNGEPTVENGRCNITLGLEFTLSYDLCHSGIMLAVGIIAQVVRMRLAVQGIGRGELQLSARPVETINLGL